MCVNFTTRSRCILETKKSGLSLTSSSPEQNRRELQDEATNATERLYYNYTIIYKGKERQQKATKVGT